MATGATEFIDTTTADVFIPELWSREEVRAREQRILFAMFVNRVFEKELKMADKLNIPNVSHLAVRTKSLNTAITYETVTETMQTITVATSEYAAIGLERHTGVQTNRNLLTTYAPEMGYALALSIDDVLAGLVDDFSQTGGTLAAEATYEDFLDAIQALDDALAPADDRVGVFSPAQEKGFDKLDQFIHGDYSKINSSVKVNAAMKNGYRGTWKGLDMYVTTNVEGSNAAGHDNAIFQRDALALVVQSKPRTERFYDIDYDTDKVATFQLHGSKEIRDDHGYWLKGA